MEVTSTHNNMFSINVASSKGLINLRWQDADLIRYYEFNQSARFVSKLPADVELAENLDFSLFKELLTQKIQNSFNIIAKKDYITRLSTVQSPVLLNVGAGASTVDLALAKYYDNSRSFLVDRDCYTLEHNSRLFTDNNTTEETVFQNSWLPFEDGVRASLLDRNRFTLLDPEDLWPQDIDLIFSLWSWGWHYNYPKYISRLKNLKSGGTLILTVLLLAEQSKDFISSISSELNTTPEIKYFEVAATERSKMQYGNSPQHGGLCIWKKH